MPQKDGRQTKFANLEQLVLHIIGELRPRVAMTPTTPGSTVAAVVNGNRVETGGSETVPHMPVAPAVFGYPVQQQDSCPRLTGRLPTAAHLNQAVAGGSVINGGRHRTSQCSQQNS